MPITIQRMEKLLEAQNVPKPDPDSGYWMENKLLIKLNIDLVEFVEDMLECYPTSPWVPNECPACNTIWVTHNKPRHFCEHCGTPIKKLEELKAGGQSHAHTPDD